MELHELSFAKIILLREDIAEVIINSGIEMDAVMVNEYHGFLLKHLKAQFSLLVNKINSYTYDFEAQEKLATLKEINAMAVISYNRITEVSTEVLSKFPRQIDWNIKIFTVRDEGLAWLISEQDKLV